MVSDDHHIDVTGRRLPALGQRTIYKGDLNSIRERTQVCLQNIRDPEGLADEAAELIDNGTLPVDLIIRLSAFHGSNKNAAFAEPAEISLYCS